MKKQIFIVPLALIALLLTGCDSMKPAVTPEATALPPIGQSTSQVIAEGRVMPREFANIYASIPGTVVTLLVKEGDVVNQGAVLLRIGESENARANLAAAQAEFVAAQQALDQLERTANLAFNQALLDEAAAKDAAQAAQKAWDDFDQDQYEKDLDKARADLADADMELKDARDEFAKYASLEKTNDKRTKAKDALDAAQKKYNDFLIAQTLLENRQLSLQSNLAVAQGRLDEAARTRQLRQSGPDKDQLTLAQARLGAAEAMLSAAQATLDQFDVKAPYDGVIARVDIAEGERALPNQVLLVIADFSQWVIETTDLTENEIVEIHSGQSVTVRFDALPELELPGTVIHVGQTFTEKSGDVVYPIRIILDESDERLHWGMTTEVWFTP